jgi:hypothetical protein
MAYLSQRAKNKEARLEIVSKLYCRNYTFRAIKKEVMERLNLTSYSLKTVKCDTEELLKRWRESEVKDVDLRVQLELTRIDETVTELWEQWERSKEGKETRKQKKKGAPFINESDEMQMQILEQAEEKYKESGLGDVRYIAEIRQQLAERRKLLGLYAPEKKEVKVSEENPKYDVNAIPDEILFELADKLQEMEHQKTMDEKCSI